MKVLIVFNHPAPYKVNLFNLLKKDIDLDVIFERRSASDRPKDFYTNNNYEFNAMFLKRGAFSKENSNTGELKKYLKEHHSEYDLIIMNGYSTLTEMRAINYLKKHNIEFALYVNGGIIKNDSKLKYKMKKRFISSATYYFSPSEKANEYLIHYGANPEKIYNYSYSTVFDSQLVARPLSQKEKEDLRKDLDLPLGRLFVSPSQFIERKNILFLLECFKGLEEKLLLIGEGPMKNEYLNYIEDNQMDNVIMKDFMPTNELFKYMKASDFFITLSKEDIYGHTINESMANGLPVISSKNVVAAHRLIKDGKNGYIVDLNEKEDLINKIKSINIDMSDAALETAKHFTIEETAKEHIEIFKSLKK